jgi:probable rRNA maturation factor
MALLHEKSYSKREWEKLLDDKLKRILLTALRSPELLARGPIARPWKVELLAVGKERMREINFQTRRKNSPTDVLSFPSPQPFFSEGFIGELVICLPLLESQAAQRGHSIQEETIVLLIHGVLHLFGMDHEEDPKEAEEMARWEGWLLEQVGYRRNLGGLIERNV